MAREYVKAVIDNTVIEKSSVDLTESCDDLDECNSEFLQCFRSEV